jgi:hypothetical protein
MPYLASYRLIAEPTAPPTAPAPAPITAPGGPATKKPPAPPRPAPAKAAQPVSASDAMTVNTNLRKWDSPRGNYRLAIANAR